MTIPHLFEFMDQVWLPGSLRTTLLEILHFGNSPPFMRYYRWVRDETRRVAIARASTTIVELGAGTAPITRLLAEDERLAGKALVACDLTPESAAYEELEKRYPGKVRGLRESVDICEPHVWPPGTVLLLSATFHHLRPAVRRRVLESLTASADAVLIFEPVRKSLLSMLFCCLSIIPALLLPLGLLARPGRLRRVVWCWLLPVAPLMFLWEGQVSCLRQWTERRWNEELRAVLSGNGRTWSIRSRRMLYQMVAW
jgi:hypothetical protein